jgi:uncharacterized protein YkwD
MRASRAIYLISLSLLLMACTSMAIATQVFNETARTENPVVPVTGDYAFGGCGGPLVTAIHPDFEQEIIEQTNEIRKQYGLSPLKHTEDLDMAARYHVADMSASNYFDHNTFRRASGRLESVCDTWQRIETYYHDWLALAENIAAGQRTPEAAIEGWMNSPDHRDNILSDSYSEIGVGFYEGIGDYRYYWGQNFGKRSGVFPLVIDGEKARTTRREVPLYIYGRFDSMRLRNGEGAWGEWMPFAHEVTWLLPDRPGIHQVTVELIGRDGHTISNDTIELVTE